MSCGIIGVDSPVAKHLSSTYGDLAPEVIKLCSDTGKRWPKKGTLLVEGYPYLEGEVRYAVREYARTAVDVLARRTRLAFLNKSAAREALPMVIEIMRKELGWDAARCAAEKQVIHLGSLYYTHDTLFGGNEIGCQRILHDHSRSSTI
jgi:glycerol-3-phosphate dehydrogenase